MATSGNGIEKRLGAAADQLWANTGVKRAEPRPRPYGKEAMRECVLPALATPALAVDEPEPPGRGPRSHREASRLSARD